MGFLSVDFFVLLPFAVAGFHLMPLARRPLYLLLLSYAFACTWSVWHSLLLVAVSLGVFRLALAMRRAPEEARLRYVGVGVVLLTGLLASFKYAPALGGRFAGIAVPLGISYWTFKLVSYLVDVYWEKLEPETDVVRFLLYPVYFPEILSGPISRARLFLPQIEALAPVPATALVEGMRLLLFGVVKKFVVADRIALLVDHVLDRPREFGSVGLWVGAVGFAIQVYTDFAGLTDIALGLSRLFGLVSPPNFDRPFYASNIQEFWRRWHMSLTTWLTDYVFSPLRLALRSWGDFGLAVAITVNMVAVGTWHGARWTYVVFGAINALYMVVSALTLKRRDKFWKRFPRWQPVRRAFGTVVTFGLVVIAFVVFRANDVSDAFYILRHLVPLDLVAAARTSSLRAAVSSNVHGLGLGFFEIHWAVLGLVAVEVTQLAIARGWLASSFVARAWPLRWAAYYAAILAVLLVGELEAREFIYAHF